MLIGPALIPFVMNVARAKTLFVLIAQITGFSKNRSIIYSPVDPNQTLSKDTNDIIKAHIDACSVLLNRTEQTSDQIIVEKEIADLKMVLDLVKYVS
jgi:hypothetical protein